MYPVVLHIGQISVYSYGLMLSIAIIVGTFLAMREAKRVGWEPGLVVDFIALAVLGGLVGSRLVYVALDPGLFLKEPWRVFFLQEGGLSLHGAVLGGVLVGIWFTRKHGIAFWKLADICAPSLALGTAIARIGCFLNGCCYGLPTGGAWGVLTRYAPGLRYPTQLFESALSLVLFFFLWKFRERTRFPGQLFFGYLLGYSLIRFGVEFFRASQAFSAWLTVAQVASLGIAAAALLIMGFLARSSYRG